MTVSGSPAAVDAAVMRERLAHWARCEYGPSAQVPDVWPMPGNSGLSFGFDVLVPGNPPGPRVIRLSPPGVARRGNTDVLRQVPLLRSLQASGIPIARVTWSTGDPDWFGTDAVVQQRLDARPLHMWEAGLDHRLAAGGAAPFLVQAIDALAAIHAAPWEDTLRDWEAPRSLESELYFWDDILGRSDQAGWVQAGRELRDVLLASRPEGTPCGVYHGDYQTNNVLYDDGGTLVAIVDWEISGLGAQLIDLGWLTLFTDASCWDAGYVAAMRVRARPEWLRDRYEQASGRSVDSFDWFRAMACFRFGAIAAFNVRLHRSGRRPDPRWDHIAPSVTTLFTRGRALALS